ncbi:MAG: alpha/beta hydrolase [Phycisphaerales bacterium]|nr:alpha/beta hydrolase [Phycisphaerales bacterium]
MPRLMEHAEPNHVERPLTASARDRVTGVDVRIDRVGSGRPVVFLNGLLGLNEHWFPVLPTLSRRSECLLIEPPLLEMKGDGCSVLGVVSLIGNLMRSLLDGPAVVVGNSLGGHVGLRLALQHPELIRGLVLIGSSGLFERTLESAQHSPSRDWLSQKIGGLFHDPARIPPGMVDRAYAELSKRTAARALVRLGKSAKNDHLGEELPKVRHPVALVWGRQDNVTPPEVCEQFGQLIPNTRTWWIDRCGHAPQIERPDEVASSIGEFLDLLDAGSFPLPARFSGVG